LVLLVHELLPKSEHHPRYDLINAFEKEVAEMGTVIVKVAMFVSLDEQKRRLRERLDGPDKYWNLNPSDISERAYWPEYQKAYQDLLARTNTDHAPWYVLPADHKWYARLAVTELLIDALTGLDLDWPPADFDIDEQL